MVLLFAVAVPVIVPVGLVYLVIRHLVDKHNMLLHPLPLDEGEKMAYRICDFVRLIIFLFQITTVGLLYLKGQSDKATLLSLLPLFTLINLIWGLLRKFYDRLTTKQKASQTMQSVRKELSLTKQGEAHEPLAGVYTPNTVLVSGKVLIAKHHSKRNTRRGIIKKKVPRAKKDMQQHGATHSGVELSDVQPQTSTLDDPSHSIDLESGKKSRKKFLDRALTRFSVQRVVYY